jgi:hypothetical protein
VVSLAWSAASRYSIRGFGLRAVPGFWRARNRSQGGGGEGMLGAAWKRWSRASEVRGFSGLDHCLGVRRARQGGGPQLSRGTEEWTRRCAW